MNNKKKLNLRELDINNIGGWPKEAQLGFCGLVALLIVVVPLVFTVSVLLVTLKLLVLKDWLPAPAVTVRLSFNVTAPVKVCVPLVLPMLSVLVPAEPERTVRLFAMVCPPLAAE